MSTEWFLIRFYTIFLYIFLFKNSTPLLHCGPQPTCGDHDPFTEDASIQVTTFLINWFFRRFFFIFFFVFLCRHPSRNHDFNKFEPTLYKDAFTQVLVFLVKWVLRRTVLKNDLISILSPVRQFYAVFVFNTR